MRLYVWRGYHDSKLVSLLRRSLQAEDLLICLPMFQRDVSFLQLFPESQTELHGEWPTDLRAKISWGALWPEQLQKARFGVFTSGTTSGKGRLIFYSAENVRFSVEGILRLFERERIQRVFCYPQPTHTFGLLLGYMAAIMNNAEIIFHAGPYGRAAHELWLTSVTANSMTLGTPTHFSDLIKIVRASGKIPTSSYTAIVGGARVTRELWMQMREVLCIEKPSVGYGATEASPGVSHLAPGTEPLEDGDIGMPLPGIEVEIFPEVGVVFRGPNVCYAIFQDGKLENPSRIQLNDSVGRREGRLIFHGRTDSIINRGGLKHSLEVIEGLLASRISAKCLAVGIHSARLGEDVGIVVAVDAAPPQFVEKVLRVCEQELQLKLSPANIVLAPIPLNANGKFDRKEALKMVLKKQDLRYPVAVDMIQSFLPHRGPAVWVDQVLDTSINAGKCSVRLKKNARYFSPEGVRESSYIEWVAQSIGYTLALNNVLDLQKISRVAEMFIAEVKETEFFPPQRPLQEGDELIVNVRCTHDFGALRVIAGEVHHGESLLARVNLKTYGA